MPRNVEVKARVHDVEKLLKRSSEICNTNGTVIQQVDTFFHVNHGRLKLRVFKEGTGELIYYDRPDSTGPKLSDYCKTSISSPEELKFVLSSSLGVKGTVEKVRTLFLYGQTRIHVDQVANLGDFMELEVMLEDTQTLEEGTAIAEELLEKLGISKSDLITGAYLDHLEK